METIKAKIYAGYSTNDDEVTATVLLVSFREKSRSRCVDDKNGVY
jgi:hypothetical protein